MTVVYFISGASLGAFLFWANQRFSFALPLGRFIGIGGKKLLSYLESINWAMVFAFLFGLLVIPADIASNATYAIEHAKDHIAGIIVVLLEGTLIICMAFIPFCHDKIIESLGSCSYTWAIRLFSCSVGSVLFLLNLLICYYSAPKMCGYVIPDSNTCVADRDIASLTGFSVDSVSQFSQLNFCVGTQLMILLGPYMVYLFVKEFPKLEV